MSAAGLAARLRLVREGFALDVDLALPGRGVSALFGASGSGKTTLLRCFAGLERAAGRLTVNGECWQDDSRFLPPHRRPLGYVFQDANLFPHLDVAANLDFGARRAGGVDAARRAHAIELLGIGHLLTRRPAQLSGGERQRVAIARALLAAPRLLLMDEPLAALDLARKQEILPYLQRLRGELDIPLLYVSHAPDEVARLADHLVVMDGGRAVAAGPIGEILARLDLPIPLGEDAGVVLEARIVARDAQWHLAQADFGGGMLWVRDGGQAVGAAVRLRILARDVSLALQPAGDSSLLNALPATVAALGEESHPALALVRLDVAGHPLLARVTRRSAHTLGLAPGRALWAQIKAVALID